MRIQSVQRTVRCWVTAASLLFCACIAYDHRWLQQHQEKQRAKERLKPATLDKKGSGPAPAPAQRRSSPVRAYATRAYAAETLNWESQFDDLLREANAILATLGLQLQNGGVALWQPQTPEDRLADLLDELAGHDAGKDAGWVVAFVKSTPHLVVDHDALGVGRVLSKYLVMRASNDPRELELLTRQYYSLSEPEVAKLHSDRRRHRMVAVFLHEIGHTLGVRHRQEKGTLMNPTYDPDHRAFDATTLGLMRRTVGLERGSLSTEAYRMVKQYYEANADGWVPSEREAMLQWLSQHVAPDLGVPSTATPGAAPSSAPPKLAASAPPGPPPLPFTTLSSNDRARYDDALQQETRSQFRDAWQTLLPLVERNARVLEVQELRCRLAGKLHLFPAVVEAHCEPAAQLSAAAAR
jgi:hypothetical protein